MDPLKKKNADDFNCFKDFGLSVENIALVQDMTCCQQESHKWGKANQASFVPSKESMHILALHGGDGSNFRLLGISFDHALSIKDAVLKMVGKATWNIAAILRIIVFFTDGELVNLYNKHMISFLKYHIAAIYNACDTVSAPLGSFQDRFLLELCISHADVLCHFNLAPLRCKRNIAMLGLIHTCALGEKPWHFQAFFQASSDHTQNT